MDYLRDHWQGRHALSRSFWLNFALPFVLIAFGETLVRPPAGAGGAVEAIIALLYIMIGYAVILPWQIVGLWRSSRHHLEERGDLGVVTFAQGAAVIALVTAVGGAAATLQHISGKEAVRQVAEAPPDYRLSFLSGEGTITIDGPFDVGLSRDLKALLASSPTVNAIVLNSDGGRVFEARGVAKQITEKGLDTFVFDHCRSACTIAFVAGKNRSLGRNGRLGFHSYKLDAVMGFVDPLEEQEKDKAFFLRQGLDADFVERAFSAPHETMWHPRGERLLRAGVIHQIVSRR